MKNTQLNTNVFKQLFLLLIIVITFKANGQNVTEEYCFEVRNPRIYSWDTINYVGNGLENCYSREYLNDSVFIEKGLWQPFPDSYMFKIWNKIWYINKNGKWNLFFNGNKNLVSYVKIGMYEFKITWKKVCNCLEDDLFLMDLTITDESLSHEGGSTYYFHPKYGIIGVVGFTKILTRRDIKDKNIISCIPEYKLSKHQLAKKYQVKRGTEFLSDSLLSGKFYFLDKDLSNKEQVLKRLKANSDVWEYYNRFLYYLDTTNNLTDFINRATVFFKGSLSLDWGLSVAWGFCYSDCDSILKNGVTDEEFKIIKYNTTHGASLIINSCLFYKKILYEEDKNYLYKKYYLPYWNKQLLNDSIMNDMHADIERLCKKLEDCN